MLSSVVCVSFVYICTHSGILSRVNNTLYGDGTHVFRGNAAPIKQIQTVTTIVEGSSGNNSGGAVRAGEIYRKGPGRRGPGRPVVSQGVRNNNVIGSEVVVPVFQFSQSLPASIRVQRCSPEIKLECRLAFGPQSSVVCSTLGLIPCSTTVG